MTRPEHSHAWVSRIVESMENALAREDRPHLKKRMKQLYESVSAHIRTEDSADGFYSEVARTKPRLIPKLEELRAQHKQILGTLKKLLADEKTPMEKLRTSLKKFLRLLNKHEKAEDKLVEEVFYRDTGTTSGGP